MKELTLIELLDLADDFCIDVRTSSETGSRLRNNATNLSLLLTASYDKLVAVQASPPTPLAGYDGLVARIERHLEDVMSPSVTHRLLGEASSALQRVASPPTPEPMRECLEWIASQTNLFFAECSQAEEIIHRVKLALAASPPTQPTCLRCQKPMTWTATAPAMNAPMEWRCFNHIDLGEVSQGPSASPPTPVAGYGGLIARIERHLEDVMSPSVTHRLLGEASTALQRVASPPTPDAEKQS